VIALPVIDAHHHIWDPVANYHPWLRDEPMIPFRYGDYSSIRRPYLAADYRRDWVGLNVVGSVYVETEWDPVDPIGETRWVHAIAARDGLPNAVVAQAWLDHDDAAAVLAAQAAFPLVRSIRHKPKASPVRADARRGQPGSMDCDRWRRGFAHLERLGLHFDLQTPWWHFDAACALAGDFPATTIIINHTGLPSDRSAEGLDGWRRAMTKLAGHTNVVLKISGLGVAGQTWTPALSGRIVRDAIAIFGPARCMFASNFPVDSLVATFAQIFDGFDVITAGYLDTDRRALFHDTAARVYRL
jgi:predicted TIM-barrel fold metal-dependent hydrolase